VTNTEEDKKDVREKKRIDMMYKNTEAELKDDIEIKG
jgi:hypothetical protein